MGFFKKQGKQGAGRADPPPHFLSGCHPVHKAGETLYPQIVFVCLPRTDGNDVSLNVFQQFLAICVSLINPHKYAPAVKGRPGEFDP